MIHLPYALDIRARDTTEHRCTACLTAQQGGRHGLAESDTRYYITWGEIVPMGTLAQHRKVVLSYVDHELPPSPHHLEQRRHRDLQHEDICVQEGPIPHGKPVAPCLYSCSCPKKSCGLAYVGRLHHARLPPRPHHLEQRRHRDLHSKGAHVITKSS